MNVSNHDRFGGPLLGNSELLPFEWCDLQLNGRKTDILVHIVVPGGGYTRYVCFTRDERGRFRKTDEICADLFVSRVRPLLQRWVQDPDYISMYHQLRRVLRRSRAAGRGGVDIDMRRVDQDDIIAYISGTCQGEE